MISYVCFFFRLKEPYSTSSIIGQMIFNCISVPKKVPLTIESVNTGLGDDEKNLIANILINDQKMICIPFGSTYAN